MYSVPTDPKQILRLIVMLAILGGLVLVATRLLSGVARKAEGAL
jgi:hypothetical protein